MKRVLSVSALFVLAVVLFLSGPVPASAVDDRPGKQPVTTSGAPTDRQDRAEVTGAGKPAKALASWSYRHYWGAINGQWVLTLNGVPVSAGQTVLVTATESDVVGNEFVGDARVTVHNVAVGNGWVAARVNVEWGSPIHIWVHYVVV